MAKTEKRERLLELIREFALTRGDFTLASGKKSSYYINVKKVILKPEGAYLSAKLMLDMIPAGVQAVGGVPLGAVPIVSSMVALSFNEKRSLDGFLIRKESKGYGTDKLIEGEVSNNMKVVIVEDVVTTAGSVLKAIENVRKYGLDVSKVILLVDRNEGGADLLRKNGLDFEAVFEIDEILG